MGEKCVCSRAHTTLQSVMIDRDIKEKYKEMPKKCHEIWKIEIQRNAREMPSSVCSRTHTSLQLPGEPLLQHTCSNTPLTNTSSQTWNKTIHHAKRQKAWKVIDICSGTTNCSVMSFVFVLWRSWLKLGEDWWCRRRRCNIRQKETEASQVCLQTDIRPGQPRTPSYNFWTDKTG